MTITDGDFAEISEAAFKNSQKYPTHPRHYAHTDVHIKSEHDGDERHDQALRDRMRREARKRRLEERVEQRRLEDERRYKAWKSRSEFKNRPDFIPLPVAPAPKAMSSSLNQMWKERYEDAFRDYTTIHDFPTPPAGRMKNKCGKSTCEGEERLLKACACDTEKAFRALVKEGEVHLGKERVRWHPDRFAACPEDKREGFQKMAKEVFVVVQRMYLASKAGGA